MLLPNATFWRIWGTAAVAIVAFLAIVLNARAETCRASFYGAESGARTANGETFRPDSARTAAHRSLPFGARLRVTVGGRSTDVRINDRGPAASTGRCLDLSRRAARDLGIESRGVAVVHFTRLN